MSLESQRSICDWADAAFGPVTDLQVCAQRAAKEMREFQFIIDNWKKMRPTVITEEMADIVITLFRLASALEVDLGRAVDTKMRKNRLRKWERDGFGNGQHIEGT